MYIQMYKNISKRAAALQVLERISLETVLKQFANWLMLRRVRIEKLF